MQPGPTGAEGEVHDHLQRLLASEAFAKSATNRRLLTYLLERHLQGADGPKEAEIAIDVFGRDASFHGGDDSVVRVAMRGMRQKLLEYYAGPGRNDRLVFDVPKGSYRLRIIEREREGAAPLAVEPVEGLPEAAPAAALPPALPAEPAPLAPAPRRALHRAWLAAACALLTISVAFNVFLWRGQPAGGGDDELSQVRASPVWRAVVGSERPVMFVLGDMFMYTQTDPVTGRVQTVRDPQISSSDDLRAFLATKPELASVRGLRYASYLQKSTAVGLARVLPIVATPGRRIEVRVRDELRAEDFGRFDIVYIGPLTRLGPLDAAIQGSSQFRFDAASSGVADVRSGKVFLPEGGLGEHRKDYALVSGFRGPEGSHVLIITAGGRNAGLAQVVRTVTTPEGLAPFDRALRQLAGEGAFQAVLAVAGYKQTDLSAELVELRGLGAAPERLSTIARPDPAASRP